MNSAGLAWFNFIENTSSIKLSAFSDVKDLDKLSDYLFNSLSEFRKEIRIAMIPMSRQARLEYLDNMQYETFQLGVIHNPISTYLDLLENHPYPTFDYQDLNIISSSTRGDALLWLGEELNKELLRPTKILPVKISPITKIPKIIQTEQYFFDLDLPFEIMHGNKPNEILDELDFFVNPDPLKENQTSTIKTLKELFRDPEKLNLVFERLIHRGIIDANHHWSSPLYGKADSLALFMVLINKNLIRSIKPTSAHKLFIATFPGLEISSRHFRNVPSTEAYDEYMRILRDL